MIVIGMRNGPRPKDQHSNASRSRGIIMMEAPNVDLISPIASQRDEHDWPLGLHNYQRAVLLHKQSNDEHNCF